jgi:hypothetical protein
VAQVLDPSCPDTHLKHRCNYVAKLKAFTWGYWGWGSESKHFVRSVDWMEKMRGFLPPVFVDLRLTRGGRATDFKGCEFEKIVGNRRYVWMPRLGNKRIETKKGKRIQIADSTAAEDLLDLIIEKAERRRRILMFCACPQPMYCGRPVCHRAVVADLLLKIAKKRRLSLELSEWPGENPVSLIVNASGPQKEAIDKDTIYIPLGPVTGRIPSLAVLGWGSSVQLEAFDTYWTMITGPADVQRGQWRLCRIEDVTRVRKAEASAVSRTFVRKAGFGAHSIRLMTSGHARSP